LPKKTKEEKRLKAIEYAYWAGNLLDEKYFDKLSKAIKKRDKAEFLKICAEAGIPENVLNDLEVDTQYLTTEEGWGGAGWGGGWD
jgi:hypothetical protein